MFVYDGVTYEAFENVNTGAWFIQPWGYNNVVNNGDIETAIDQTYIG